VTKDGHVLLPSGLAAGASVRDPAPSCGGLAVCASCASRPDAPCSRQTLVGWAGTPRARRGGAASFKERFRVRCAPPRRRKGVRGGGMTGPSFPERQPVSDFIDPWGPVVDRLRAATIGDYDIGYELGRGGMAAVFLAYDLALARHVAIKVMSPALLMGEG